MMMSILQLLVWKITSMISLPLTVVPGEVTINTELDFEQTDFLILKSLQQIQKE